MFQMLIWCFLYFQDKHKRVQQQLQLEQYFALHEQSMLLDRESLQRFLILFGHAYIWLFFHIQLI